LLVRPHHPILSFCLVPCTATPPLVPLSRVLRHLTLVCAYVRVYLCLGPCPTHPPSAATMVRGSLSLMSIAGSLHGLYHRAASTSPFLYSFVLRPGSFLFFRLLPLPSCPLPQYCEAPPPTLCHTSCWLLVFVSSRTQVRG